MAPLVFPLLDLSAAGRFSPKLLLAFGMSLHGTRMLAGGGRTAEILTASALKSAVMPAVAFVVGRFLFNLDQPMLLGMAVARETILLSTAAAAPVLILVVWLLAG